MDKKEEFLSGKSEIESDLSMLIDDLLLGVKLLAPNCRSRYKSKEFLDWQDWLVSDIQKIVALARDLISTMSYLRSIEGVDMDEEGE